MNTVHLQSVGKCNAVPASELEVGDVMIWNFGSTSVVKSITAKGKQSLTLVEISDSTGTEWTRTFRKTRLVAISLRARAARQAG